MDTVPETEQRLAKYVMEAHKDLSDLVKQQFARSTGFAVLVVVTIFAVLAGLYSLTSEPVNPELLLQLHEANDELSRISQALAQAQGLDARLLGQALQAIDAQAELHQQAIEELRRTDTEISPEGLSILQLLGGSAVLALLGYLGLQRLQNLDVELANLRKFMFDQIELRVEQSRDVLKSTVDTEVDRRLAKIAGQLEQAQLDMANLTKESRVHLEGVAADFGSRVQEQARAIEEVEGRIGTMVEQYQWLREPQARQLADRIASLSSVEQAHEAAREFNLRGDATTAKMALQQIVERGLPGSADDYHNAHTEAMQMNDPMLAFGIVQEGLAKFQDQFDLMADKAIVLVSLGKRNEAVELLLDWRSRKPEEFARGWRPVVFLEDAAQAGDLTPELAEQVRAALREVTERLPLEVKPWGEWSSFERSLGRIGESERVLREGLGYNPLSQQLNYMLGLLMLQQGRTAEAIEFLERAHQVDFQEQYQFDVNPFAVRATLAQAYETSGQADKAELLYRSIIASRHRRAIHALKEYARARLEAITLQKGQLLEPDDDEEPAMPPKQLLDLLRQVSEGPYALKAKKQRRSPDLDAGNDSEEASDD